MGLDIKKVRRLAKKLASIMMKRKKIKIVKLSQSATLVYPNYLMMK